MRLTGGHAFLLPINASLQEEQALAFAVSALSPLSAPAKQRVLTGNHPDVLYLRPEGARIKIQQCRALMAQLGRRPFEGGKRAVVILQADSMTQQAQNCLLKTLEEPAGPTVFGLFCAQPGLLLETVRSRCVLLAPGAPAGPKEDGSLAPMMSFFTALSPADAQQHFPDKAEGAKHCLAQWMEGISQVLHLPLDQRPAPLQPYALPQLAGLARPLSQAYQMILANVSPKMVAEWLWIQWKEEQA